MDQFFKNGFEQYRDLELASLFKSYPLEKIHWTDDGSAAELQFYRTFPLGEALLTQVQALIGQKYISKICPRYSCVRKRIWTSFTEDQLVYHNDTYKETADSQQDRQGGDAPYNVLALLYLSDMTPFNEGAVWFRSETSEVRILPQIGTLILVNCARPEFQHRAEWTEAPRYLAQFGYQILVSELLGAG